jgi:hypothetical protein
MTREEVIEEKIRPLISVIFGLCKEHNIPWISILQESEDEGSESDLVTTAILPKPGTGELLLTIMKLLALGTTSESDPSKPLQEFLKKISEKETEEALWREDLDKTEHSD